MRSRGAGPQGLGFEHFLAWARARTSGAAASSGWPLRAAIILMGSPFPAFPVKHFEARVGNSSRFSGVLQRRGFKRRTRGASGRVAGECGWPG